MTDQRSVVMPVGVILRREPGATRWVKAHWSVAGIIPAAASGDGPGAGPVAGPVAGTVLRDAGDVCDVHAGTVELRLWRTDAEAYLTALNGKPPSVFVILRRPPNASAEARPELLTVTASAYEAQDYAESGEDIVEKVAMPGWMQAWVNDFATLHYHEEQFVKRQRKGERRPVADGVGDPRIRQPRDVYRAPGAFRRDES